MTLFCKMRRLGALVLAPLLVTATLLAACGGGTEQVSKFKPNRLFVFGDDNSVIENDGNNDGFKYTVNDRSLATAGKCLVLPTFVQDVALMYGFAFEQCNPLSVTPKAFMRAARLAKVADVAQQVANQSDMNAGDIATLMVGINDLIEIYEQMPKSTGLTNANNKAAIAEAGRRGTQAAAIVNSLLATGARGLVFTVPDISLSPYAVFAEMNQPGSTALLASMSYEFNAFLRTSINSAAFDGRNYGLVLADDIVAAMHRLPSSYLSAPSVANVSACSNVVDGGTGDDVATQVLACNTTTLVANATSASHLWASDRHMGPTAHQRIGAQATARASNNPF
jgi:outer membrane lipase/esterase